MRDTKIEWSDHSWSPWIGCTKVSPGCANCYAEHLMDKRMKRVNWGKGNPRKRTSAAYWKQPLQWQKQFVESYGMELMHPPISVFPSLCDWLDPEVPIEWLADFLALIHATPNLRWLLLTKRPELFEPRMCQFWIYHCSHPRLASFQSWVSTWHIDNDPQANVAVGVSAEDQTRWNARVPVLLNISARWRFVSVEPMLGPIEMKGYWGMKPDQVIFGGESGPGARPCNVEWIRDGVRQCRAAKVKAFVKQLGSNPSCECGEIPNPPGIQHPKGGDPSEWPEDLRVREAL